MQGIRPAAAACSISGGGEAALEGSNKFSCIVKGTVLLVR
jgi:hypothetical protein